MSKIAKVKFEHPAPGHVFSKAGNTRVLALLDDGMIETVFYFYDDELQFIEEDFIGKTVAEAHQMKFDRDVAYLQS